MGGSGWKLYLVCELESGSGQLFEFNQKKQAQGGLSYLRTRKLHGTRQSRPRPSSRVSRTWEEVPTLSNQVHPYSTFLTDKGRAPARAAAACPMIVSGAAPPMVDALRRVRRCMSRRVFCRFCHARPRVPIVFGPSIIAPPVNVLRRTRRKSSTIRGGAPDVVIGQSTAARAGARPYRRRRSGSVLALLTILESFCYDTATRVLSSEL